MQAGHVLMGGAGPFSGLPLPAALAGRSAPWHGPGRLDAVQRHVDDVSDKSVVQWRVSGQQPVPEWAVDQVNRYLDVGAGGDLAALGGAAEYGSPCPT